MDRTPAWVFCSSLMLAALAHGQVEFRRLDQVTGRDLELEGTFWQLLAAGASGGLRGR